MSSHHMWYSEYASVCWQYGHEIHQPEALHPHNKNISKSAMSQTQKKCRPRSTPTNPPTLQAYKHVFPYIQCPHSGLCSLAEQMCTDHKAAAECASDVCSELIRELSCHSQQDQTTGMSVCVCVCVFSVQADRKESQSNKRRGPSKHNAVCKSAFYRQFGLFRQRRKEPNALLRPRTCITPRDKHREAFQLHPINSLHNSNMVSFRRLTQTWDGGGKKKKKGVEGVIYVVGFVILMQRGNGVKCCDPWVHFIFRIPFRVQAACGVM